MWFLNNLQEVAGRLARYCHAGSMSTQPDALFGIGASDAMGSEGLQG